MQTLMARIIPVAAGFCVGFGLTEYGVPFWVTMGIAFAIIAVCEHNIQKQRQQ